MERTVGRRSFVWVLTLLALLALVASLVLPVTGDTDTGGDSIKAQPLGAIPVPQAANLAVTGAVVGGTHVGGSFVGDGRGLVNLTNVTGLLGRPFGFSSLTNEGVLFVDNNKWTLGQLTSDNILDGSLKSVDIGTNAITVNNVAAGTGILAKDTNNFLRIDAGGGDDLFMGSFANFGQTTGGQGGVQIGIGKQGAGTLTVNGTAGNDLIEVGPGPGGYGRVTVYAPNGSRNVLLGGLNADPNDGYFAVHNNLDQDKVRVGINTLNEGFIETDRLTATNVRFGGAAIGATNITTTNITKGTIQDLTVVNLTVTGKKVGFKIDHPQDPANKYLVHTPVESDENVNVYSGNITTNARGEATVVLPDYFEALNRDFRYQLTVIGEFAQAIVAKKIRNHRFTIKTDKPSVEVSWQVTGARQDAYAKANPLEVELYKQGSERGRYLHPELYGRPREQGIHYQAPVSGLEPRTNLARTRE